jgi:MFS family permease
VTSAATNHRRSGESSRGQDTGSTHQNTPRSLRTWALVIAVALAFADASVVALALPDLYIEFHASIVGVSWVLTVYAAVAAVGGLVSRPVTARLGSGRTTALGLVLFAAASVACGVAPSLGVLLGARAVQAVGAAALLEGSLGVLAAEPGGTAVARRWWMAAGTFGAVLGPALGGAVTQLADWRAVFLVQAPITLLAVPAAWSARHHADAEVSTKRRPAGALWADLAHVATFAGLVGALFLGVLLLVVVWGLDPIVGAVVVSALPVGTFAGRALGERAEARLTVVTGALLLATGLLTLALIPEVDEVWVAAGLLTAGIGFGALSTVLGPIAVPPDVDLGVAAARSSAARHLGLVIGLVVVAPILASGVEAGTDRAILNGTATVLDARTDLVQKVRVAWDVRTLIVDADAAEVPDLDPVFAQYGDGDDVRALQRDLDDAVKSSITRGFRAAFLAGALLALLAAVPGTIAVTRAALPRTGLQRASGALLAATVAALVVPAVAWRGDAREFGTYTPVDACEAAPDPFSGGGIDGLAQRALLGGLNGAACELGTTREELVLSLDPDGSVGDRRWDDATIERALKAGARRAIDDADERDSIPGLVADALRFAVDRAPLGQLIQWLT